ncbi:MAG: WD40/YVTN/BNR-like repeat-containing protein [Myxococcales bacterium]
MKLFVATRKGLFQIRRGSQRWEIESVQFAGTPVTMVLPAGEDVFAAVGHGHFGAKLHRSRDAGKTFAEVAAPAYPKQPEGTPPEKDRMGRTIPWSLEMIWSLEISGGTLWAGTLPGGLFRSDDRGASWSLSRSLWDRPERKAWMGGGYDYPGIHSLALDGDRVVAGVSTGGLWVSEDKGTSWELCGKGMWAAYMPPEKKFDLVSQDVHRIARCAAAPEVLWVQHHNGAFRSTDGGRSFVELAVPPSSFGFAVAAHPRDPQTAWFVPAVKDEFRFPVGAAMSVARTRDGGRTFEVLREGLPQEHAYHLVYRHGLDVDPTGEALAMASTTGALWASDDHGASWTAVSRDLPPVYAVRFAS